jgi:DNA polymerase III sliding clamp (beta) subunit (PCNA family)
MEFVTKLVEGKFPDYNRVIPKDHTNTVLLGPSNRCCPACSALPS